MNGTVPVVIADAAPWRDGTVTSFDPAVGLGEVLGDDGATLPFHCVEIADGSRSIDPGTAVTYAVLAKLGRREAAALRRRR